MKELIFNTFENQFYMLKKTWQFSKAFFLGKMLLAVLSGIMPTVNVYVFKMLVDKITGSDWKASVFFVVLIAMIDITYAVIRAFLNRIIGVKGDLFRNGLVFDLHNVSVNMDCALLFTPQMIKNKEMAAQAAGGNVATRYLDLTLSFLSSVISIVSIGYVLSAVSVWVFGVIVLMSALKILTVVSDRRKSYNNSVDMASLNTKISYYMTMLMDEKYASDMRMYSISGWVMKKYKTLLAEVHVMMKKLLTKLFGNSVLRASFGTVENLIFNLFLTFQVIFRGMSFANFSMFLSALKTLSGNIASIANGVVEMAENSAYMNIYREFVNTKNVIAVEGKGIPAENIAEKEPIFSLEDVSFAYPGSSELILKHVNIDFEKGKFYVIVGANGEGKTTLTKLLCRLYDVSEGRILYNGTDIRDIEYRSYRKGIGIVFQDYKYYNLSIAENIATASYDESDDVRKRIYSCLCVAGLKTKIDSLPNGIDTQLGKIFDEEGILLSGGEVQKLALARMLFNNPDIFILDEPSSALDAFAENDLIQTFNTSLSGKTVLYISHRLSVAKYADKVLFMSDHTVAGFDNHSQLMSSCPQYREMYYAQAKHYDESK